MGRDAEAGDARTLVLVACSALKSARGPDVASTLGPGPLGVGEAAALWGAALASRTERVPARDLYRGRGFRRAAAAAAARGATLAVASAGLGLVLGDDPVPPYDATVGREGPSPRAAVPGFRSSAWWAALGEGAWGRDLAEVAAGFDVVACALGADYLAMLGPDLARLEAARPGTLRLFCLARAMPAALVGAAMPDGPGVDRHAGGPAGDRAARRVAQRLAHPAPLSRDRAAEARLVADLVT